MSGLRISQAAEAVGASPSALRRWEREGLVRPRRSESGYRVYSPDDVARLRAVRRMRRVELVNGPGIRRLLAQGARIREPHRRRTAAAPARICAGLALRDAADRCGMSASHLSAIERGSANPSVAALQRITRAYDTTLVELTRPDASGRVVRRTERAVTTLGDGVRIEQLALRPGQLEPHLFVLEPDATSEGAYAHDGEEFLYVLAGAVTDLDRHGRVPRPARRGRPHLSLHPAAPLAQHRRRGDAPAMDQHATDLLTDWNALRDGVPSVWARYTDLVVARGEGAWLETIDGARYLDYTSGIGVTNTGHAHPKVAAAIAAQAARGIHLQQNIVYHQAGLELHDRLPRRFPNPVRDTAYGLFLSNSGAEAVEAAVKLAKMATHRTNVVAFRGGFHGRTHGAMALTSSGVKYRGHFEPLLGGVHFVPFPYPLRLGGEESALADHPRRPRRAVRDARLPRRRGRIPGGADHRRGRIRHAARWLPERPARGGRPPRDPARRRRGADRLCPHRPLLRDRVDRCDPRHRDHGEGHRVRVAALRHPRAADLLARFAPGAHGGTYGGNVVACAAALATLDVIDDEHLVDRAMQIGDRLLAGLRRVTDGHRTVAEVRGRGAMVAIELAEGPSLTPRPDLAKALLAEALARNLLLLTCGTYGQVVRIIPPLVTTDDEVELAVTAIGAALEAIGA